MIEARAVVLRLDAKTAVVAVSDMATCSQCENAGGCGAIQLSRLLCAGPREYRVANPIGAQPGDRVTIGAPDGVLLKSAVAVYLIPLFLLVAGALLGGLAAPDGLSRDGYAVIGFLVAFLVSGVLIRVLSRRGGSMDAPPVILSREP